MSKTQRDETQTQRVYVEFSTRQYEFAHGHGPRGFGAWAFQICDPRNGASVGEPFWVYQSLYSDAKKKAREHAIGVARAAESTCIDVDVLS